MTNIEQILENALNNGKVQHPAGHFLDVKANISRANSEALRKFVRDLQPELVVEIGMAHGVSTLSILDSLNANGHGRLISIDPYLGWPTGRLVALHQIERAGVQSLHQHLHEPSYTGLPRLIDQGLKADLVYIDGNHDYDYVFTDFFLSDKLLAEGGVIGFNDAGWRSVYRVIRYIRRHLGYKELDVDLPRVYRSRNPIFSMIKRLEGRSTYDRYFRKP